VTPAPARRCEVHIHRSFVPLEVHHVWPKGEGGPDIPANRVTLCSNGHGQVHDLLAKVKHAGDIKAVPLTVRLRYGRKVRKVAYLGWQRMQAKRL
jgi:HNH endonuclease